MTSGPNKLAFVLAVLIVCSLVMAPGAQRPLSEMPDAQQQALRKRLAAYVAAYRGQKWDHLYDLVSDTAKGGFDRDRFILAMKREHGRDFAQMPDLVKFDPDRSERNDDGLDIYGCGSAIREGATFNGVAVTHVIFEHNDWFFTGWTFTKFPNESCKVFADSTWRPPDRNKWSGPMDEVAHFKEAGVPFHVDSSH